jgi:hypothetical protein
VAESNIVKNFRDGTLSLLDGTGTPVTYTITCEQGDLKVGGQNFSGKSYEVSVTEDRGEVCALRKTNRKYPTFSFSVYFRAFTGVSGSGTVKDFLLFRNAYSANTSTTTLGDVKTIDIKLAIEGTDLGDAVDHTTTLEDCIIDAVDFEEGDPNRLMVSGRVVGLINDTGVV